jgi:hypothetical protein
LKKQWVYRVVGLGSILFIFAGIPPAMADPYQLGGDEESVKGVKETPSFGTEDWVGAQEEAPVVAMETPSFGTEDWVGAQDEAPVVAMETSSFGTEDWIGTMEYSHVLETGALPSAVPGEPWTGNNYSE